jgi:hypothetical protein
MARKRDIATKEHVSGATFAPPYPPSWFDRLTDWVDRLPGPAWAYYLILGAIAVLVGAAIQWREGGFAVGTLKALPAWNFANFAFLLGLMHYLDKTAASAMVSFRPLLLPARSPRRRSSEDERTFRALSYRLTTLPARPALIATLVGMAFVAIGVVPQLASGTLPTPFVGTARTALSNASVMGALLLSNALTFLLFYHSVHQLSHVSRIYTEHARINPTSSNLYALSRPGAFTALGLIAYTYTWYAVSASAGRGPASLEAGLTLASAAIAAAAFALPLLGAHRRLVAEKEARLAEASARFEAATIELHSQLERGRLTQMDQLNKALSSLEIEQNALRKIPTWPWQPGGIRAVVAALLLPVAVWAIQLLLERILEV